MSYEELDNWIDINAPNLNKGVLHTQVAAIAGEGGGGESALIVTVTEENLVYTADKTFAEILEAFNSGRLVLVKSVDDGHPIIGPVTLLFISEGGGGAISMVSNFIPASLSAGADDDYPSYDDN